MTDILSDSQTPTLTEYQEVGARWLVDQGRAILADDLGLGKTATAIRAVEMTGLNHALVICPKTLIPQWQAEVSKFLRRKEVSLSFISYDSFRSNFDKYLPYSSRQVLIVDEASFIKSPKAQRSQAVVRAALLYPYVFFLTATPVRNHPSDLINMLYVCSYPKVPNYVTSNKPFPILPSIWWRFVRTYFRTKPGYFGGVEIGDILPNKLTEWDKLLSETMLRRTKEILSLPPLSREIVAVPWSIKQELIYSDLVHGLLRESDGTAVPISNALAISTRMRQACLNPMLFGGIDESGKAEWLKEYMEGTGQYHRTLVFCTQASYIQYLAKYLCKYNPVALYGDLSPLEREKSIEAFQKGRSNLFLISTLAGGYGLNLQTADVVIHTDLPWTSDEWEQATGRAYRKGQTMPVHEIILTHPKSIDEHILKLCNQKKDIASKTLAISTVLQQIIEDER